MLYLEKEVKSISDELGLDKEKTIGLSYMMKRVFEKLVKKEVANKNSELMFGEKPLHDIDSELALLGLSIKFPKQSKEKTINITKDYFFDERNGIIWESIEYIRSQKYEPTTSMIKSYVKSKSHSELITDSFIDSLPIGYVDDKHIGQYLEMVSGLYQLRSLIHVCHTTIEKSYQTPSSGAIGLKSQTLVKIEQIKDVSQTDKFDDSSSMIKSERERLKLQRERLASGVKLLGISTGLVKLDESCLGLCAATVYVLAGRPGMGKSALAIIIFWNVAKQEIPVAFFSLEMPTSQLTGRLWAIENERNSDDWKLGKVTEEEEEAFYEIFDPLPIYIDDEAGLSIDDFEARATFLVKEKGVKLLIIDYLQLMSGHVGKKYGSNREQEVSDISKKIKEISKNLNVPIIPLSQLSRANEKRGGTKRPILADLRESGSIEQDADLVWFVYRGEYYDIIEDNEGESLIGVGEVIVAKFREGALDSIKFAFDGNCIKWSDYDDFPYEAYTNQSVENKKQVFLSDQGRKTFTELMDGEEW